MRYDLTDFEWSVIEPVLPRKSRGVPRVDDRRVLNGIFRALRSGTPWADLPERYGPRTTCYNRFRRWTQAGIWDRTMDAITEAYGGDVRMIDGTSVRVHHSAATLKKSYPDRCLGPSRGGLTSKIADRGAWANIPPRSNRKDPVCFSPWLYKTRNAIERFFNKLKYFRRIATRYDKLGTTYLAMIKLAAIRILLRAYESTA